MALDISRRRVGIIMAGGSGERFWPLSRADRPKQLLKLTSPDRSLLEEAVERLAPIIPRERILIVTAAHLVSAVEAAGIVPSANVLGEPCKRNTGGCLVYAAAHCLHRFGEAAGELGVAVLTADHRIGSPECFRAAVEAGLVAVEGEPVLGTVGIRPTCADTGYGYIEVETAATGGAGGVPLVLPVARFCEKPDRQTAAAFVASGRFYWNSGMFFWRWSTFLAELRLAHPELAAAAGELADALRQGDAGRERQIFERLPNLSIDYALMEKARRVVMVRGDFPWDDVGAWSSLDRFLERDGQGNVVVGGAVAIDTRDCVIYNEPGCERLAVGVLGVTGLAIIVTDDAVLVVPKEQAQEVRRVVAALKERGARQV